MPSRLPFVDYLVLDPEPHLQAHECVACKALFLDRRNGCARCGRQAFQHRRLSNQGVVRAFTIVHRASGNIAVPYVSAIVELDGGGIVKANLADLEPDPEHVKVGMRVELATREVGTDDHGNQAISFFYTPVADAATDSTLMITKEDS